MATETGESYELLRTSASQTFEDLYAIYASAIEAREQKSRAQISALATRDDYEVLLVKRANRVVGFSALFFPAQESFCLLEYMAVDSSYRNMGIGAKLFRHGIQMAKHDKKRSIILLEVDSDRENSPDQATRRRRENFYRRLGCLRIDGLSYLLPLESADPMLEMNLMVYFTGAVPVVRKSELEHWLKVLYQGAYDCSPDDPRIARMIEFVSDPVSLR